MQGNPDSYFIGTGLIHDVYSEGRYIFNDNADSEYFLYSDNNYKIGDEIFLNGYITPAYTGFQNKLNLNSQRDDFISLAFVPQGVEYEFDYPKRLMMKGIQGTIHEQTTVYVGPTELSFIQNIRSGLQEKTLNTYGETRDSGLILGMLIGDRSAMAQEDYAEFIDSGLVHIIAVSGGNIIMIVVFLSFVLFFIPLYPRNALILAVVILYAMVCGLDSSVFRATIMGALAILALFAGREISVWRMMGIAFIIMLLVNPYFLVYDVGFLLSFSAIIGIIYFNKYIDNKLGDKLNLSKSKFKTALKNYIVPTIGATLGVLPVMMFFMGTINLSGIFANFLVIPIVPFVMIYGFISLFLYQLISRSFFLRIEKAAIWYIYKISGLAVELGAYLSVEGMRIKYLILVFFLIWFVHERLFTKLPSPDLSADQACLDHTFKPNLTN